MPSTFIRIDLGPSVGVFAAQLHLITAPPEVLAAFERGDNQAPFVEEFRGALQQAAWVLQTALPAGRA